MKRTSTIWTSLFIVVMFLFSLAAQAQKAGGPWNVPAKYKAMKSSVKAGDAAAEKLGKDLFAKHCKSCHGGTGAGDGPKAASLNTLIPSFKDAKFKAQSDGEIYYQSFVGRNEMPNFEKKITDEGDRWSVVQYLKSLK